MSLGRKNLPHKMSLAMRHILEERGIDLVAMQLDVYRKAMSAYDEMRGFSEKNDAGPAYLGICNQAIGTLAKYAFPTMTAIRVEDLNTETNKKVIDAVAIRQTILNDPFAKSAADAASKPQELGLPVLPKGESDKP